MSFRLALFFIFLLPFVGCGTFPTQKNIGTQHNLIALTQVASEYQYDIVWKRPKAILSRSKNRIILESGNPFVSVNGKVISISPAPIMKEREIWVSPSLKKTIAGIAKSEVNVKPKISTPAKKSFARKLEPILPMEINPELLMPAKSGLTIVLDPGHGGKDPGGLSRSGKPNEKDIVLLLSQKIAALLESQGIEVKLTRQTDHFIPLFQRVSQVDSSHQVFVSIHINSNLNPTCNGYEIIYQTMGHHPGARKEQSKKLANSILSKLQEKVPHTRNRGLKKNQRHLHVLKNCKIPAVLVELGFISNPEEEKLLNDYDYQTKLATAVVQGIQDALPINGN